MNTRKHLTTAGIALFVHTVSADITGTWQQEVVSGLDESGTQKLEALIDVEWNQDISDSVSLTAIGSLRLDSSDELGSPDRKPNNFSSINGPLQRGQQAEARLRELYLDAEWFGAYWRLGKQQVVWGQSDGLKVLDLINPQSYREFILDDFDDSRIPLWMVNVEIPLDDNSNLQLLWIPDSTYHEMPAQEGPYGFSSKKLIPQLPGGASAATSVKIEDAKKTSRLFSDSDLGLRYSTFSHGWDITLNYLYHYRDFAVLYQQVNTNGVTIQPEYERNHLLGATASNAFGDFTLRTEIGWNSDSFHLSTDLRPNQTRQGIAESRELSSVVGLDWQGLTDTFISVQWFQSHLLDYDHTIIRNQNEQTLSFLLERNFVNETWKLELLALHSLNDHDQLWRPQLTYVLQSNLEIWLGADMFRGDKQGLYGQFDQTDRLTLGFQWGF